MAHVRDGAARRAGAATAARVAPYEKIRAAIIGQEFAPHQPLVESELAAWCGVSRTPIREALRRLEQDGLVTWGERGLVVRERSPQEILDIYEVRIALEGTVARSAAERRTEHDLLRLRAALAQSSSLSDPTSDDLIASNRNFHRAVWHAAHNEALLDHLDRVELHLARYPETTLAAPGRWETALAEHADMIEAIDQRDGERAQRLALEHFTEARDIRLALFAADLTH